MRVRSLALIGAILASVSAQGACAQPLQATSGHIDPLLSLSLLASQHSHAVVCARGDVSAGADMVAGSANCSAQGGGSEPFEPEAIAFGNAAEAHSAWLALLSPTMFAAAWYGFMSALTNDVHVRGPVSPS